MKSKFRNYPLRTRGLIASNTGDCVSISIFFCSQVFLATELIRKFCVLWLSLHVYNMSFRLMSFVKLSFSAIAEARLFSNKREPLVCG